MTFDIAKLAQDLGVGAWDAYLTLLNLVSPSRKVGHVTPAGHPGFGGKWPEYVAPKEGDSRCSCPALNAMANHGQHELHHSTTLVTCLVD